MRNLKSTGLMPIRKPVIKFNINDLLPNSKNMLDYSVKSDPKSGTDPILNTLFQFSLSLPINKLYCPSLRCDVLDDVLI